jgi:hypothetical protein
VACLVLVVLMIPVNFLGLCHMMLRYTFFQLFVKLLHYLEGWPGFLVLVLGLFLFCIAFGDLWLYTMVTGTVLGNNDWRKGLLAEMAKDKWK